MQVLLRLMHKTAWTLWLTGLSGSGKSTLASALSRHLETLALPHEVVDGDQMRRGLCADLGFSKADRNENVRRIGYVAELLNRHGVIAIVAAIAPYRHARNMLREQIDNFVEVHVDCSIATLSDRDTKGLYKRALAGEITCFSGISDPYEEPLQPDIYINSEDQSKEECIALLVSRLEELNYLPRSNSIANAG